MRVKEGIDMNKKQKKMLARILIAAALLIGFNFLPFTDMSDLFSI